ncbi:MAG TPA: superoxide dismutase family protein, partial [Polyangiaceae bacterium]|nr:superoxide dismutase family protein [Polyangiaceae bacterium]
MHKLSATLAIIGVSSVLGMLACGGSQPSAQAPAALPPAAEPAPAPGASAKTVQATFQAKSGSSLTGTATLSEVPEGVKAVVSLENLSPGEHGIHVHEKGDCSAADGSSAGGHFNPAGAPHALPANAPHHLGDWGNINVGADGKGTLDIVVPGANLKDGDPNSYLGRAIIVHEKV